MLPVLAALTTGRKQLNDLADLVNSKIEAVCQENPECVFVDANPSLDTYDGHFCQPGVDETLKSSGGKDGFDRFVGPPPWRRHLVMLETKRPAES